MSDFSESNRAQLVTDSIQMSVSWQQGLEEGKTRAQRLGHLEADIRLSIAAMPRQFASSVSRLSEPKVKTQAQSFAIQSTMEKGVDTNFQRLRSAFRKHLFRVSLHFLQRSHVGSPWIALDRFG